jgi:hypothetical protein
MCGQHLLVQCGAEPLFLRSGLPVVTGRELVDRFSHVGDQSARVNKAATLLKANPPYLLLSVPRVAFEENRVQDVHTPVTQPKSRSRSILQRYSRGIHQVCVIVICLERSDGKVLEMNIDRSKACPGCSSLHATLPDRLAGSLAQKSTAPFGPHFL